MAALKVISRASVMGYAAPNTPPLQQVARELGVGSIVLGSVQVVENRIRVHVQLVDPATDAQRWAERYDRSLKDAFALQSDVAQQIVSVVGAGLTNAERERFSEAPTANPEAYLLYLQGLDYQRRPGYVGSNYELAEQLYEHALALDPDFALARAALSQVHGSMYWTRYDMTPARLARMREEAEAALRLAPDLPEAHLAMSVVHNVGPGTDVRAGLEENRIALRSLPNDAAVWRRIAGSHRRLGNWNSAVAAFERAVQLGPRDVDLLWDQGGLTYDRAGRFADAVRWYNRALSLAPDVPQAAINKGWAYLSWHGHLDTLRAVLRPVVQRAGLGRAWSYPHAQLLLLERQADSLLRLLAVTPFAVFAGGVEFEPTSLFAAWAHQLRGDRPAARAAFESALVLLDSAILKYPDDWPVHRARGLALAGLGRREEALREARWLREGLIYRQDAFLRRSVAAGASQILAQAGAADAALDVIEELLAERPAAWGFSLHLLRLDPRWDPIREHPRFEALLAKYAVN